MKRMLSMATISAMVVTGSLLAVVGTTGVASAATSGHTSSAGHGRAVRQGPPQRRTGGRSHRSSGSHLVIPGKWTNVTSPNASGYDYLNSVSCTSAAFCAAVGTDDSGPTNQGVFSMWNGTTWKLAPSPNVSTPTHGSYIETVSCATATFCLAVGDSYVPMSPTPDATLVDRWDGVKWSVVSSPNPTPSNENDLYSVDCTSTTFCMAVGETYNDVTHTGNPLSFRWNGSTWTSISAPAAATGHENWFNDVSCQGTSWCMGVGASYNGSFDQAQSGLWTGSSWNFVTPVNPNTTHSVELESVSCPSPSMCVAGGYFYDNSDTENNLIEQWGPTGWSQATIPSITAPNGGEIYGVDCWGTTSCTAVGYVYGAGDTYITSSLAWNGKVWVSQPPLNPSPASVVQSYLNDVSCVGGHFCITVGGYSPVLGTYSTMIQSAPITRPGYRFVAGDGGVFALGGASFNGSAGNLVLNKPVVGMAATPDGGGYWLVATDGGIFSYGDAHFFGSTGNIALNKPIVGMATTPDGSGYWLVASDGGIFAFGNAKFFGSTGSLTLNQPIVGMAATPSGQGYWLVASDGGIFSFGDAHFHGSTGNIVLNKPIVGMAATPSGNGYWLVASDGGIFSFGDAHFHGSAGNLTLNKPVVGMASDPSGQGYWLVASDGGIFSYGDATFHGSTGNLTLNSPIVGMTA
jgi:hypothetical protein